ncbi:MAG: GDSL family lipase [Ruminococcus sp.]|nr:GDSL family lipase [Ruminococcus sp.]
MKPLQLSTGNTKHIGRTVYRDGVLYPVQSGSGCEFRFTGRRLDITIGCGKDIVKSAPFCNKPRFAVLVNGRFSVKKVAELAEESYTVIESDTPVTADIRIIKLSEAAFSVGEVTAATDDDAVIVPAEVKPFRIEFIGDSITCAYGVDDSNTQSEFATEAENAMKSYGYLAAEMLGAEYSLFSYSGHGIISGWTETGERNTREIIVPYYGSAGFSYALAGDTAPQDIPWDNSALPADIVVVNLGTNDFSYCSANANKGAVGEFAREYLRFLRTVREKNPAAEIIAALGIMNADLYSQVEQAAQALRAEGDSRVRSFRFTMQDGRLGYGSNWHPSAETHLRAAEEIAAFIRAELPEICGRR